MVLNENAKGKQKPNRMRGNAPHKRSAAPSKPGLEARIAASRLLAAVVDRKTSLDGMLDQEHGNPAYLALNDADRGLVKAILQSALRHLPRIDHIIGQLLDSPLPDGARSLHHLLVVAAAQMLYLDVPDHSAVDRQAEQERRTAERPVPPPDARAVQAESGQEALRAAVAERDGEQHDQAEPRLGVACQDCRPPRMRDAFANADA